jgi:small subunit ribosomal protein S17
MADETPEEVDETAAGTPAAEAPEPEAETEPTAEATAPAPAAPEPQEVLAPKERRARSRAAKAAKSKPRVAMTPEERHAERLADRARKAQQRRAARAKARAEATRSSSGSTAAREHAPGVQKTRQGVVVSDKADKTITVRIDTARRHRRYEKIVRTSRTLHAHDERNDAHTGDTVVVRESRPLSRTKRWRLVEVVERAK